MAPPRFKFEQPSLGYGTLRTTVESIDEVVDTLQQSFEEVLCAQLNSALNQSSPIYKKFFKYIPAVARYYALKCKLRTIKELREHRDDIRVNGPLDEDFDVVGEAWMEVDQYEEALTAFITAIDLSERKGPWWLQTLCVRYSHLAQANMALDNTQEQLRASMRSTCFAAAAKDTAPNNITDQVLAMSFCNLAMQFLKCDRPEFVVEFFQADLLDMLQGWDNHLAGRSHTLQENLDLGTQGIFTEDDLCFAMADFLIHNNGDVYRTMLALLKRSSSQSFSELDYGPSLASRECQNLMKVCRMETLNNVEQSEDPGALLRFALELLEIATLEPLPMPGAKASPVKVSVSLISDDEGLPCYPGLSIWLKEAAPDKSISAEMAKAGPRGSAKIVPFEGSCYEELVAILTRLQSKSWNLRDSHESKAFANVGRDLGKWATSSYTAAVSPFQNIEIALFSLNKMIVTLRGHLQHHAAKFMLQDVVFEWTNHINPKLIEIWNSILVEYVQICSWTGDSEDLFKCCTGAIRLAKQNQMDLEECKYNILLGIAYARIRNALQAEKVLNNARNIMIQNVEVSKNMEIIQAILGAEGSLALLKAKNCGSNIIQATNHSKIAVDKLKASLKIIIETSSKDIRYHEKFNRIITSLRLSEALSMRGSYPEALHLCQEARRAAEELQLHSISADAACSSGNLAETLGNFETAERYYREGLQILEKHECDEQFQSGRLYRSLGSTLQKRGKSRLPEAETAFRQAIEAYSRILSTERILTSEIRISTFERLKLSFYDLQVCLYEIYVQADEAERTQLRIKPIEALVVAERARCRDLALNLEEIIRSRIADNEEHDVDVLDWRKFDRDFDYAWGHLKRCMAICTDAIKEHHSEVQRVTFVEYTLTQSRILIWVLHSHGTEELHTSSPPPSMYCVHVKEDKEFEKLVMEEIPGVKEDFGWMYGPKREFHYNAVLQESQDLHAVLMFEEFIERLRSDPEPGTRKLIKLYELLIGPIADKLVVDEPVIFIPHEGLSFVPFAALMPKQGKHLIENHPIGIASSLRTLGWATKASTSLKESITKENPMLLVADPFPLGVDKDPLEDSVEEVTKIAALLPKNSTVTLLRDKATLEKVTAAMKTTSWFHIACHGEVTDEYPQGVLFLSDNGRANPSEGHVTFSEQHRIGGCFTPETISKDVGCMTAHATVLSACKVGLGKKTGEGLLGLSRAFMQVGVPLVIAPLRTVHSRLGSAFMQHLYKKLVAGESAMFALRHTMIDVIEKRVTVLATVEKEEKDELDDDEEEEDDDEEEEDDEIQWQVWDWAAWVAVGFPGACMPSYNPQYPQTNRVK